MASPLLSKLCTEEGENYESMQCHVGRPFLKRNLHTDTASPSIFVQVEFGKEAP